MSTKYVCKQCGAVATQTKKETGTLGTWRCRVHGKTPVKRVKEGDK